MASTKKCAVALFFGRLCKVLTSYRNEGRHDRVTTRFNENGFMMYGQSQAAELADGHSRPRVFLG